MSGPKRIQRKRTKGWRMPEGAVYVGRPSKWGNPFPVGALGPVYANFQFHEAVGYDPRYQFWFIDVPGQEARHLPLAELRGRDLACWCPLDQPCHADVLLEIANGVTA